MRGWRKFAVALLFWLTASAGLAAGWLAGGEFVAIAGLVVGLYGGANALVRFAENGK